MNKPVYRYKFNNVTGKMDAKRDYLVEIFGADARRGEDYGDRMHRKHDHASVSGERYGGGIYLLYYLVKGLLQVLWWVFKELVRLTVYVAGIIQNNLRGKGRNEGSGTGGDQAGIR